MGIDQSGDSSLRFITEAHTTSSALTTVDANIDIMPKPSSETCTSGKVQLTTSHLSKKQSRELRSGRWSLDEKILFLYGLNKFGKGRWKKMSIYLPHRSLVQIKSHAQKVLKRLDAGENVYRRMEENRKRLDMLIAEAHERVGLPADALNRTKPKRKSRVAMHNSDPSIENLRQQLPGKNCNGKSRGFANPASSNGHAPKISKMMISSSSVKKVEPCISNAYDMFSDDPVGRGAVIAAAALCQLSSCGAWDRR